MARAPRDLPCTWTDSGIRWRVEQLPRLGLGDADNAYLRRNLDGNYAFAYNYEFQVWHGDDLVAFVLNSRTPNRKLAATLVQRAFRRYEDAATT
jgi:hypothetical protein